MDTISIGVLLPLSTILPMGKDFEKGLKQGLKQAGDGLEVEIVKEFIGQGDVKQVDKACNKFFSFDEVNLVTGVIPNRAVNEVAERFKKQQVPFLVNNLGENVPDVLKLNEQMFLNSPQLWRHAYAMGYWGVKQFGKKGMFVSSVYDAGYSFSQMFHAGMKAADPDSEWFFSVPPLPPPGGLTDMSIIFPFLEQYEPDFIFAVFCGAETTLFLNEMIARGWHKRTKITALPYLLAPFNPLNDGVTVYTATLFEDEPEIQPEKAFFNLGLQTGKIIAKAAIAAVDNDIAAQLAKVNTLFNVDHSVAASSKITILQNDIVAGEQQFSTKPVGTCDAYPMDSESLKPLTAEISAGWMNPYLGI